MCADLFGMGGTHGNRKDTGHRKKSLSGFKYTQIVNRLVNFIDAI